MTNLRVLTVPDPRLQKKALPVREVDASILKLLDDMLETMYAYEGCGLAATQVGVLKRVVVIDVREKCPETSVLKMINPEITWVSQTMESCKEGCLSVPDQFSVIERPSIIHISYVNEKSQAVRQEVSGFLATCMQHEMDHLDGKLFIDYLPQNERENMVRNVQERVEAL